MASRYIKTDIVNFNEFNSYGLFEPPLWIQSITDADLVNFSVTNDLAGRADLISERLYGTTRMYWVLVYINKPLDPTNWPKSGELILTPKTEIVRANT